MIDSFEVLESALRKTVAAFRPAPRQTVSEWADLKRKLSLDGSPEPGQWKTADNPLQREVMDAFTDPRVETVVLKSSAQVGKTETILNVCGYHIANDPAPILIVRPTEEEAKAFSKDRLATMLRATPALQGLVLEPRVKGSDNTLFHKKFSGGHVTIAWSESQAGLASRPIRICLCDEIDLYTVDAVSKGVKRTTRFWNRKIGLFSTPTYEDTSAIDAKFKASDQRYPHVPCPLCGAFQKLDWEHVQWQAGRPETAVYVCAHCSRAWTDGQRSIALQDAVWRAEAPFRDTAGFALWEAHVPFSPLGKMATEFVEAKHRNDMGDSEPLMNWTNLTLGACWSLKGKTLAPEPLMERRENYSAGALPYRILYLTAGVDVQDNRLEVEIVGWRREKRDDIEESWGVEKLYLYGDPAKKEVWGELDQLLKREWTTEDGRRLRVGAACIDSGGHHTEEVYRFCQQKAGRHIYAVKGIDGARLIWTPRAGQSKKYKGALVWSVGVETAKARIYNQLRVETPGPGFCHFPLEYDAEFFKQLTSEEVRTKFFHGKAALYFFLPKGHRNESLDCRVYALAALNSKSVPWEALLRAAPSEPPKPPPGGPPDAKKTIVVPPAPVAPAQRRKVRFKFG